MAEKGGFEPPLGCLVQIPDSTRCCSESIGYVRMRCLIVGQRATVREQLCNYCATRIFNGLPCRCTPITSVNDGASCGFPTFRRAAPKWRIQSIPARFSVRTERAN